MKAYNEYTIEEFLKFCQEKFEYGWISQDGEKHRGINDALSYCLQSPKELLESKMGICWDMTELYRDYFEKMTNLRFDTYFLLYDDNKGCPNHTILVYYKDDKVFWFEPMFQGEEVYYSGIHEYNNINELLRDFKTVWIKWAIVCNYIPKDYDENKISIYRFSKPKYHINGYEMRDHIDGSQLILFEDLE